MTVTNYVNPVPGYSTIVTFQHNKSLKFSFHMGLLGSKFSSRSLHMAGTGAVLRRTLLIDDKNLCISFRSMLFCASSITFSSCCSLLLRWIRFSSLLILSYSLLSQIPNYIHRNHLLVAFFSFITRWHSLFNKEKHGENTMSLHVAVLGSLSFSAKRWWCGIGTKTSEHVDSWWMAHITSAFN